MGIVKVKIQTSKKAQYNKPVIDYCGICREKKKSVRWYDTWENYVCDECDKVMDEGYKECYQDR